MAPLIIIVLDSAANEPVGNLLFFSNVKIRAAMSLRRLADTRQDRESRFNH
jgi:hypothetical protein